MKAYLTIRNLFEAYSKNLADLYTNEEMEEIVIQYFPGTAASILYDRFVRNMTIKDLIEKYGESQWEIQKLIKNSALSLYRFMKMGQFKDLLKNPKEQK